MISAVVRLLGGAFGSVFLYGGIALVVLLATGLGFDHAWTIPRLEARVEKAEHERDEEKTGRLADRTVAAEVARKQEATFRQIEQRWFTKQQETEHEAQTKIAAAKADAASAAAASGRLRDRLAALGAAARRSPSGAAAPAECAPAIQAVDLQSDVLRRLVERGRELAAYADSARIAGDACVAAWPLNKEGSP